MESFALITGGNKGIGKSIAMELAKRKHNVLLVARSEKELSEVSNTLTHQYQVHAH